MPADGELQLPKLLGSKARQNVPEFVIARVVVVVEACRPMLLKGE